MMKREALKKCRAQWIWMMSAAEYADVKQEDGAADQCLTLHKLKRQYFESLDIAYANQPLNGCYLCEYSMVDGVADCLTCPLKGYAWGQCEDITSPYALFEEAIENEMYDQAAEYAEWIIDACDEALNDLEDDDDEA